MKIIIIDTFRDDGHKESVVDLPIYAELKKLSHTQPYPHADFNVEIEKRPPVHPGFGPAHSAAYAYASLAVQSGWLQRYVGNIDDEGANAPTKVDVRV